MGRRALLGHRELSAPVQSNWCLAISPVIARSSHSAVWRVKIGVGGILVKNCGALQTLHHAPRGRQRQRIVFTARDGGLTGHLPARRRTGRAPERHRCLLHAIDWSAVSERRLGRPIPTADRPPLRACICPGCRLLPRASTGRRFGRAGRRCGDDRPGPVAAVADAVSERATDRAPAPVVDLERAGRPVVPILLRAVVTEPEIGRAPSSDAGVGSW